MHASAEKMYQIPFDLFPYVLMKYFRFSTQQNLATTSMQNGKLQGLWAFHVQKSNNLAFCTLENINSIFKNQE